ncbi:MAG: amino acid permease [Bacteroidetes bacterium CG12_big_fil_rev_8_21_14_0_65_60_17]|nr:MAG: amino acid permease [Bacteroidetes bacterium CG12_big_fil_rev_8_21_14_0_65_60_17]
MVTTTSEQAGAATDGRRGHGFGVLPVFLAGISTILGAIMFLRFGYAVGHVGWLGAMVIILLGHMVTIPTALALAEIATNRKVEGGGEYFIISRSFGTSIGSVIGISLYLSQAISVAFYMIAFAEAFQPFASAFEAYTGYAMDPRFISFPATLALVAIMIFKGASMGVRMLYVVAATLGAALVMFFLGSPVDGFDPGTASISGTIANADPLVLVFAIVFPAFTGMTAGVGLSGDLANPRKAIPRGTIAATLVGMVVYVAIVTKLAFSASAEDLATDQLIMMRISAWGPIILIGLGAATISSAIGSILVAPRTIQALAVDASLPVGRLNRWLARGEGDVNEPRRATIATGSIALFVVLLGDVDFVARLISMFFMVTYGSLCAISFLENFASRPSYRPSFRSRWYISLFGALICLFMMFQMDPLFALLALAVMVGLYQVIARSTAGSGHDLADMFEGAMSQLTRYLHVKLQVRSGHEVDREWRPSMIMVNERTFDRRAPLQLLRWISHRYGFGTYLHFIPGVLNRETYQESVRQRDRLLELVEGQDNAVYLDTIVSPSMTSALAQSLQLPGVSGIANNSIMFEFSIHDPREVVSEIVDSAEFSASTNMSQFVLRHGDHFFGDQKRIHIWLTWNDDTNANVMILLGYILLGHRDWDDAEISVFAALPKDQIVEQRLEIEKLIDEGRLPISEKNITYLATDDRHEFLDLVTERSADADLTIIGFDGEGLAERREDLFLNHPALPCVLFVRAAQEIQME